MSNPVSNRNRGPGRPFQPGNPGRPKGSRNRFSEDFVRAAHADFEVHGPEIFAKLRDESAYHYLRIMLALVPKQFELQTTSQIEELSDEEIAELLHFCRTEIARQNAEEQGGEQAEDAEQPLQLPPPES